MAPNTAAASVWTQREGLGLQYRKKPPAPVFDFSVTRKQMMPSPDALALKTSEEPSAMEILCDVAARLRGTPDAGSGLSTVLSAVVRLLHADMGTVQIVDQRGALYVAAHQGFESAPPEAFPAEYLKEIEGSRHLTIEDADTNGPGTQWRAAIHAAGCRALESTPLRDPHGKLIGILSAYFRAVRPCTEAELRHLDFCASMAAIFIGNCNAGESRRVSDERFRRLAEVAAQIIWEVDAQGRLLQDSHSWQEFTGLAFEQSRNLSWLDAIHPDDRPSVSAALNASAEAGTRRSVEVRVRRHSGDYRYVSLDAIPLQESEAGIRVLIACTDITDIKRAVLAETVARQRGPFLETSFETAVQGIIAVDLAGRIELTNRIADRMFGYERNELPGLEFERLLPLPKADTHHRESLMTAPVQCVMGLDLTGRRKDGSLFPVDISLSSVETEHGRWALWFIADISSQKRREEELQALRVSALTSQEDLTREIARELHDGVNQKLALLSMGIGKAALECPDRNLSRKLNSFRERIVDISDDIRDVSHRMHPSILDELGLTAAIEEMCFEMQETCGLAVDLDLCAVDEPLERTVASCLYRVCQESLSNVLRHARTENVRVELTWEDNALRLTVLDRGLGFDLARVTNGLGLYSMQERVRMVSGRIMIKSQPGKGTCVAASVPVRPQAPSS